MDGLSLVVLIVGTIILTAFTAGAWEMLNTTNPKPPRHQR